MFNSFCTFPYGMTTNFGGLWQHRVPDMSMGFQMPMFSMGMMPSMFMMMPQQSSYQPQQNSLTEKYFFHNLSDAEIEQIMAQIQSGQDPTQITGGDGTSTTLRRTTTTAPAAQTTRYSELTPAEQLAEQRNIAADLYNSSKRNNSGPVVQRLNSENFVDMMKYWDANYKGQSGCKDDLITQCISYGNNAHEERNGRHILGVLTEMAAVKGVSVDREIASVEAALKSKNGYTIQNSLKTLYNKIEPANTVANTQTTNRNLNNINETAGNLNRRA